MMKFLALFFPPDTSALEAEHAKIAEAWSLLENGGTIKYLPDGFRYEPFDRPPENSIEALARMVS